MNDQGKARRPMRAEDWINSVAFLGIGLFLGIALEALLRLVFSGAWALAIGVVLPFLGFLLFYIVLNKLYDKIFPSGIRPARNAKTKGGTPLIRLFSFPAGLMIGVVVASLGFGTAILALLPG